MMLLMSRRSSVVEQRTRNAQVIGSSPIAGSRSIKGFRATVSPNGFVLGHPWGTLASRRRGQFQKGLLLIKPPALLDQMRIGRQRKSRAAVPQLLADVEYWFSPS